MDPLKPNQVAQFHKTLHNQTTRLSNKGKPPAQSLHYLLSLSHRRHFTDAASAMIGQQQQTARGTVTALGAGSAVLSQDDGAYSRGAEVCEQHKVAQAEFQLPVGAAVQ